MNEIPPTKTSKGAGRPLRENATIQAFTRKDQKDGLGKRVYLSPIAVTIKQAANLVGTNDKHIRRAIYAREIPVARLGKSYSIAVADLIK